MLGSDTGMTDSIFDGAGASFAQALQRSGISATMQAESANHLSVNQRVAEAQEACKPVMPKKVIIDLESSQNKLVEKHSQAIAIVREALALALTTSSSLGEEAVKAARADDAGLQGMIATRVWRSGLLQVVSATPTSKDFALGPAMLPHAWGRDAVNHALDAHSLLLTAVSASTIDSDATAALTGLMDSLVKAVATLDCVELSLFLNRLCTGIGFVDTRFSGPLDLQVCVSRLEGFIGLLLGQALVKAKVVQMSSSGKTLPVTMASELVHVVLLDGRLMGLQEADTEDGVKLHDKFLTDSIKSLKALAVSVGQADKVLKDTLSKRSKTHEQASSKLTQQDRKREQRSEKQDAKRVKAIEAVIQKTGIHPLFAWKGSSIKDFQTFQTHAEMTAENSMMNSLEPIIISKVSDHFLSLIEENQVKKTIAVFKQQYKSTSAGQSIGKAAANDKRQYPLLWGTFAPQTPGLTTKWRLWSFCRVAVAPCNPTK